MKIYTLFTVDINFGACIQFAPVSAQGCGPNQLLNLFVTTRSLLFQSNIRAYTISRLVDHSSAHLIFADGSSPVTTLSIRLHWIPLAGLRCQEHIVISLMLIRFEHACIQICCNPVLNRHECGEESQIFYTKSAKKRNPLCRCFEFACQCLDNTCVGQKASH